MQIRHYFYDLQADIPSIKRKTQILVVIAKTYYSSARTMYSIGQFILAHLNNVWILRYFNYDGKET